MKKLMLISLIVVLTTVLAACGGSNTAGTTSTTNTNNENSGSSEPAVEEKVKLSLWHHMAGDDLKSQTMREMIEQFQADHPNIELDVQAIPSDGYRPRLKTVAAANEMPDVFIMWPNTMTKEFASGNLLEPINELIDSKTEWANSFAPGSFNGFTVDGNIYSAPTGLTPTGFLYYNKAIFAEHGLEKPETWDQLISAVETLKEAGVTPIALGNKAAWPAQSSILSALADRVTGTEWLLDAAALNGAKFTDDVFIEALETFQNLSEIGAFQDGFNSIDHTQAEHMLAREEAAMLIDGGWAIPELSATATPEILENIEVVKLPTIPGGKGNPDTVSGVVGTGFALSSGVDAKQKEAALELIYALSGPEAQQKIVNSSQLVSYKVDPDPEKVSSLFIKANKLLTQVELTPVYDNELTSAASTAINNGLQELLIGTDAAEVAQKLQDAQEKALQE
jgi:raffinose/stachyose/melibiose transport system substrate-binding protein